MRKLMTALTAAGLLALAPLPAFAHHKQNHNIPTSAQRQETQSVRNPCHAVGHNPRQQGAHRAMVERCRDLSEQAQANANDAALRQRCADAARAMTGTPC